MVLLLLSENGGESVGWEKVFIIDFDFLLFNLAPFECLDQVVEILYYATLLGVVAVPPDEGIEVLLVVESGAENVPIVER